MRVPVSTAHQLLRRIHAGALSTISTHVPGYPYASLLPFCCDAAGCPLFLISQLAEHTQNLLADSRASLVVTDADGSDGLLSAARLTVVGDALPFDPDPMTRDRYIRFHPDADRYLQLGDFRFFRLQPVKLRLIAGFGQMGWLEPDTYLKAWNWSAEDEARLLKELGENLPEGVELIGIDPLGLDMIVHGLRQRREWEHAGTTADAVRQLAVANLRGRR